MAGTTLEGEHLHPYTSGTVSKDKCHGKKQIYAGTKDPDCAGINQKPVQAADFKAIGLKWPRLSITN